MTDDQVKPESRCGFVAMVGRPNVGKSTLINHLLGQKLNITSRKPQTTRQRLLGIKTLDNTQIIYVDTPGMHLGIDKAINRYMNKTVSNTIVDVDVLIFMLDKLKWTEEDEKVLENLQNAKCPVILVINKIDQLADKEKLLPFIEQASIKYPFKEIVPLSALKGHNTENVEQAVIQYLPENVHLYPEDQLTDKNARFLAAEFIREKITRQMGDELPYEVAVEIEAFKAEPGLMTISALILVEREGQKRMLIGSKGSRLKLIGSEARKELELLFDSKIMLNLWVKVKSGWSDDDRALRSLGFE